MRSKKGKQDFKNITNEMIARNTRATEDNIFSKEPDSKREDDFHNILKMHTSAQKSEMDWTIKLRTSRLE